MDVIIDFIDRFAEFVSCSSKPPLIYAAMQRTRSFNTPAPLVGFTFLDKGELGPWNIGGRPWVLRPNHLGFGNCHQGSASPEPEVPIELWAVAFNLEGVSEFDDLWTMPVRGSVAVRNPARVLAAFQSISERFFGGAATDPILLKAAILELFGIARREFAQTDEDSSVQPTAVRQAREWIAEHLHDPSICLADIAREAGLSPHHFIRVFTGAAGISPMRYLRDLRIRQSIGLLQATDLRVNEIAAAVGFRDPLHFSRAFHAATGKSPSAMRDQARA